MIFYDIELVLDMCNLFFKPADHLCKTPIQIEDDRIKALSNTMDYLIGETRC